MKKLLIAGLTALALAGTAPAFAQAPAPAPEATAKHKNWHPSEADMKAFTDARVAALKAGLALTPDQEKNWPAVEQAIRDIAAARQARFAKWHEEKADHESHDAIAKMRRHADAMTQRAADIKKFADAAEPLYRSLTDEQKHRWHLLVQHVLKGHHGGHHHHGGHGGWHHGGEDRG
jgi:hypothetical protein